MEVSALLSLCARTVKKNSQLEYTVLMQEAVQLKVSLSFRIYKTINTPPPPSMIGEDFGLVETSIDKIVRYFVTFYNLLQITHF